MNRWQTFLKERFPLLENTIPLLFYYGGNALVALALLPKKPDVPWIEMILSFCVTVFMFLHLRIFDEIKDFKTDCIIHPERPLARGILSLKEAKQGALFLIAIELFLSSFLGLAASISALLAILYSLFMYNEFFIGKWLRQKLATYALTHTIVSAWISLFIFSSLGTYFWKAPKLYFLFAFANWMLFNIFEFARKTFGKEEEKELVESYSKNFGPWGASFLVVLIGFILTMIALIIGSSLKLPCTFSLLMLLLLGIAFIFSFQYGNCNTTCAARQFRVAWSAFILLYNALIMIGIVIW